MGNQLPNGPSDGGLTVMTGTAPLFEQYFKEHQPVSLRSKAPLSSIATGEPSRKDQIFRLLSSLS